MKRVTVEASPFVAQTLPSASTTSRGPKPVLNLPKIRTGLCNREARPA